MYGSRFQIKMIYFPLLSGLIILGIEFNLPASGLVSALSLKTTSQADLKLTLCKFGTTSAGLWYAEENLDERIVFKTGTGSLTDRILGRHLNIQRWFPFIIESVWI